jgi:hypothetical protein
MPESSASANVIIKCHNGCKDPRYYWALYSLPWNEASKKGWTWDKEGTPYEAYYCEHCSAKIKYAPTVSVELKQ